MTLKYSADNSGSISLYSRSRALGSAFPPEYILLKVLLGQFKTCGNTIQHHSDETAMRLTEYGNSEFSAERVHYELLRLMFVMIDIHHITLLVDIFESLRVVENDILLDIFLVNLLKKLDILIK